MVSVAVLVIHNHLESERVLNAGRPCVIYGSNWIALREVNTAINNINALDCCLPHSTLTLFGELDESSSEGLCLGEAADLLVFHPRLSAHCIPISVSPQLGQYCSDIPDQRVNPCHSKIGRWRCSVV